MISCFSTSVYNRSGNTRMVYYFFFKSQLFCERSLRELPTVGFEYLINQTSFSKKNIRTEIGLFSKPTTRSRKKKKKITRSVSNKRIFAQACLCPSTLFPCWQGNPILRGIRHVADRDIQNYTARIK